MHPEKQMCSKLCVIISFSYQFWLNCFQEQSCSSPRDLSNYMLQDKNEIKLWLPKKVETYVSPRNLSLSLRKVHCSPRNNHVPKEKEFKLPLEQLNLFFPQGIIMSLWRKSISCLREQPCAQGSKCLSCMGGITMFLGNKCVRIFVWS
jgi:hypothetical protein